MSCDPPYQFSAAQIRQRIDETATEVLGQARQNAHEFVWDGAPPDLALCSDFLFLYSQQRDLSFHLQSMRELCRVARQVRVFPLLALGGAPSPHLAATREALESDGFTVTVERVPYEFQRGGNEMLRIRHA